MKEVIKSLFSDKWIIFIIILSAVVRFSAVFYLQEYKNPESWEFGEIADNLIKGNGFSWTNFNSIPLQPTSIQAPFYPYLLAFFLKYIPNPYLTLEIIQILISIIAGLFLFLSAGEIFNKTIGYASFTFYSLHPTFIYIPTQFLPLCIYLMQLGIGIYILMKINKKSKITLLIYYGINSGIALLTDPIFIIFIISSGIYWVFILYNKKVELIKILLITFGVTFLTIFPWSLRNYKVHHQFVFVKSNFGYNLWRGNHFNATGTGRLPDGSDIDLTTSEELAKKLILPEYLIEIKRDNLFREEGWNFIKSNPIYFSKLAVKKFYYFWWFDPTHPKTKNIIFKLSYIVILLPGLAGIYLSRKEWKRFSIFYLHFLLLSIIYSITIVLPRYHMQIDYILIIFGCYFFQYIYKTISKKK